MTIAQGATNTFKVGLMDGSYDLAAGSFKIALYTGAASIGPETTAYTTDGEVVGTGYTAGGEALTITQVPTIGNQTGGKRVFGNFNGSYEVKVSSSSLSLPKENIEFFFG